MYAGCSRNMSNILRGDSIHQNKEKSLINMGPEIHTFWVLYICSWRPKTRVTNIVRVGSTYHNIKNDNYTWFRKLILSATCRPTLVHRRYSTWRPFMTLLWEVLKNWRSSIAMHPCALRQRLWPYSTYLFSRCLPCLSRRWTHTQTSSVTMDKCTYLGKYAFPDPGFLEFFFLVLVGTTTPQNILHFFKHPIDGEGSAFPTSTLD